VTQVTIPKEALNPKTKPSEPEVKPPVSEPKKAPVPSKTYSLPEKAKTTAGLYWGEKGTDTFTHVSPYFGFVTPLDSPRDKDSFRLLSQTPPELLSETKSEALIKNRFETDKQESQKYPPMVMLSLITQKVLNLNASKKLKGFAEIGFLPDTKNFTSAQNDIVDFLEREAETVNQFFARTGARGILFTSSPRGMMLDWDGRVLVVPCLNQIDLIKLKKKFQEMENPPDPDPLSDFHFLHAIIEK
jgi:hypothetical protein